MDESQLAKETTSANGRRQLLTKCCGKGVAPGDIADFGGVVPMFGR